MLSLCLYMSLRLSSLAPLTSGVTRHHLSHWAEAQEQEFLLCVPTAQTTVKLDCSGELLRVHEKLLSNRQGEESEQHSSSFYVKGLF